MSADIKNFQSNLSMNFHKNGYVEQIFTMPKLIEYSKKKLLEDPSAPNFPKGYLPEMKFEDPNSVSDIFMNTVAKTFEIDGAQCVRFILLDRKGKIYDDLDLWTQVLPESFLARVSCSYRNFDPNSITLDYFIDMTCIQLNNEIEFGSTTISMIDKKIEGGFATRDDRKIEIDYRIADFNNHKNEIFIDFFKYDFGSAVKGTKLAY